MIVFQSAQLFQPQANESPKRKFTMPQLISAVHNAGVETEKWLYPRMEAYTKDTFLFSSNVGKTEFATALNEYNKAENKRIAITLDNGDVAALQTNGASLVKKSGSKNYKIKNEDGLLHIYTNRESYFRTNVCLGPAVYCYRYRVSDAHVSLDEGIGATTRQELALHMKKAAGYGIPFAAADAPLARKLGVRFDESKLASDEECFSVFMVHCLSRLRDGKDYGRKYIVKHLFEQGAEFENTEESQVRYSTTISELRDGVGRAFFSLASLKNPPAGFMAGHASYPVAEKELRKAYSSIISVLPPSSGAPVSLSPHFLRGFVRKEMKYDGLIVTDDMFMPGMRDYLKTIRPSLPKDVQALSDPALFFVLAVYAGANWPLYVKGFDASEKKEVQGLYISSPQFRRVFDSLALESLFLKLRTINPADGMIGGLSLPDLSAQQEFLTAEKRKKIGELASVFKQGAHGAQGEFEAKFMILASRAAINEHTGLYEIPPGLPKPVLDCVQFFSRIDEVWSRNGIIDMFFRQKVVEGLTGKSFPGPDDFEKEADWLEALMRNKVFSEAYGKVDWNGTMMRAIFGSYYQEICAKNSEKSARDLKSIVPTKTK